MEIRNVQTLSNAKAERGGCKVATIKDGPKKGLSFIVFADKTSAYISKKAKDLLTEKGAAALALLSFGEIQKIDQETGEISWIPSVYPTPTGLVGELTQTSWSYNLHVV